MRHHPQIALPVSTNHKVVADRDPLPEHYACVAVPLEEQTFWNYTPGLDSFFVKPRGNSHGGMVVVESDPVGKVAAYKTNRVATRFQTGCEPIRFYAAEHS